ncbi:MAG: polysaccharide biosynthesis C-terminal domain-containing protein [Bacteroidota bacterium]
MSKLRALASDTVIYGLSTFLGRFLTFMLTPIYTNFISQTALGDITGLYSYIAFFNIIYSFGFETAFLRFFKKDEKETSQRAFSNSFLAILTISGAFTLFFTLFAQPLADSKLIVELSNGAFLIRMAAFIAFADALMLIPFALLRMLGKSKKFALLKFAVIVVNVALNFLLVFHLHWGADGIVIAGLGSSLFGVLILLPEILAYFRPKIDAILLKDMFRFGLPTVPASFSMIVLSVIDRPILKALTNSATVGVYQANYRLALPMMMTITMFEAAYKPFYLSHAKDADSKPLFARVLKYFTLIAAIVFLVTSLFMEFVVRMDFIGGKFINPSYWVGLSIIPIVMAGYYFNGVFTNLAAGFHITKQTKYLPIATGIAAASNVALNFLLIPFYGFWGSAWATFGAYFIGAVALYYFTRKVYPLDYDFKRIGTILALTAGVYFATVYFTDGLSIWVSFAIRAAAFLAFFALLGVTGFFTKGEIISLKGLFKKSPPLQKSVSTQTLTKEPPPAGQ